MSLKALSWAMSTTIPKYADRLVLIVLAEHASGDEHETWPGLELIAREANLNEKTARTALRNLVRSGHITRVVNGAPQPKGVTTNRGRRNLYSLRVGWDEMSPPDGTLGWDNPEPSGWDNSGASGGTNPAEAAQDTYISEPEVEPEQANTAVPAAPSPPEELTPRQRAKRLMDAYWSWCRSTYNRDPDIAPVALVRLLAPLLEQGIEDRRVGWALRELHEGGRPITRATLGAQIDGRGARGRPRQDVVQTVQSMQFDAAGNLIEG